MTEKKSGGPLGYPRQYAWWADTDHVDLSMAGPEPRRVRIPACRQDVVLDLNRTALMIIDLQNDFTSWGGWVHEAVDGDPTPNQAGIPHLNALTPLLRELDVPVIWVNWGNRPDLANMPPNQIHLYMRYGDATALRPDGTKLHGPGLGQPLSNGARVLEKDSWAAAIHSDLIQDREKDIYVDKYRISGFWDTPLDSILRNLGIRTILFAGCNTDQCVLMTLTDANFLGYGCVMLKDCCTTTSPAFCTQASHWEVEQCYGWTANSGDVIRAIREQLG